MTGLERSCVFGGQAQGNDLPVVKFQRMEATLEPNENFASSPGITSLPLTSMVFVPPGMTRFVPNCLEKEKQQKFAIRHTVSPNSASFATILVHTRTYLMTPSSM